ncbi:hypothetical protein [Clostridium cuniculi]|uniref:hypothetical protein n=1 Tax=Clostridium cuniculi TaxID=2548455 RepID=UPI001056DE16|nr:hypothetical protein [Clostridium cuniculi]
MNLWTLINERELGQKIEEDNGKINENTNVGLRCYIKYLKNDKKLNKTQIRNEIDRLMMENYKGFVMGDWDETLQGMVNKYSKKKYCEYKNYNNEVVLFKEELDFIKNVGGLSGVKDIEIEKILFIMLVLAKSSGSEWVNYSSRDIFKLSRFKYRQKSDIQAVQREKLIYDLAHYTNGQILNVTNFGTSPSIKLLFCKDEGIEEIKIKIDIKSIENIVVEYLKWRNKENYTYCIECGKEIKIKSNRQQYCSKCFKILRKDYKKNKQREYRGEIVDN